MDDRLKERLEKLDEQRQALCKAENIFLKLEANKRAMFSKLFIEAEGKNVTEKECRAYLTEDWKNFAAGLVQAECDYNNEKRKYEILIKAYDAEHLSYKHELPAIKRQGA